WREVAQVAVDLHRFARRAAVKQRLEVAVLDVAMIGRAPRKIAKERDDARIVVLDQHAQADDELVIDRRQWRRERALDVLDRRRRAPPVEDREQVVRLAERAVARDGGAEMIARGVEILRLERGDAELELALDVEVARRGRRELRRRTERRAHYRGRRVLD